MPYRVTKTYGHELGLSACFRQPRAESHCRFIHGYALGFKFVFEADELDANNWVKDFGSLKPLKQQLIDTFDHKLLIARDDPALRVFQKLCRPMRLEEGGLAVSNFDAPPEHYKELGLLAPVVDLVVLPHVGCEAFANLAYCWADNLITPEERARGVRVAEVECREHAGNAASYIPKHMGE